MEAFKAKELVIVHSNEPGVGASVFGIVADAGANVEAFCGYIVGDQVVLTMVTDNNPKVRAALRRRNFSVETRPIVCVRVANRPGVFFEITQRLAAADVDLDYAYTSVGAKSKALVVLQSSDDSKAVKVLSN